MVKKVVVAMVALVAAGVLVWIFGPWGDDDDSRSSAGVADGAVAAADEYVEAWSNGTLDQIQFHPDSPDVAGVVALVTAGLGGSEIPTPVAEVLEVEPVPDASDRVVATIAVTWTFGPERTWEYETRTRVVEDVDGVWKVQWTPASVEPGLVAGDVLQAIRTPAERGQILDRTGQPLVPDRGTVVVGIQPGRADDPEATARQAAAIVGVDPEELVMRVAVAGPEEFVNVITLARADYDVVRDQIRPLPGTVFREEHTPSGLPADYAVGVLGITGPATAEQAAASEGRVVEGDVVGLTGLQLGQDEVLGGQPGLTIQSIATTEGATPRALKAFPAVAGRSVTITLDERIQRVADQVTSATEQPSAVVVVDTRNGDVLAVSNGPAGSRAFNRALVGRYSPGSVFKIPTTLALLEQGVTPETVVGCPEEFIVGKQFTNAGGFALGDVPFRSIFARSCNTGFVGQVDTIDIERLSEVAGQLGYRSHDDLGLPVFGGSVPTDGDRTDVAASMIGQARVEGSVLSVALTSASVANGSSLNPRLVIDEADPEPTPGEALPAAHLPALRDLMRAVVTEGTGDALAGVPGEPVHAKTGTAEFGTEVPPRTHAWISGYQGNLAFAVLVEDGGGGGSVAGPIARDLLTILASGT